MSPDQPGSAGLGLTALDAPEVVEERLSLLAAALDGVVELGVFTDEELAALDDLALTPAQPSPWYGGLTGEEKQVALTAALRGLTARGVFRAEPVDTTADAYVALLDPTLAATLTMRRYVPHVVVAERTTADFVDWVVLYPQRARVLLAEYIDHRGLHAFVLGLADDSFDRLAAWVGSFDAEPPSLDATFDRAALEGRPEALGPVTRALFATTLTRLAPGNAETTHWSALYTGPEGAYLATQQGDALRYRGLDAEGLLAHLREAVL